MAFDPSIVREFRFVSRTFNKETAVASFVYGFDDDERFVEELTFTGADTGALTPDRQAALDLCLHHLHLMLGVSYYKAAIPRHILIETDPIDAETARFFDEVYLKGLGEFAYRNGLNLQDRIHFPCSIAADPVPSSISLTRRTAVPVGGGKDSVVSIEALRSANEPLVLFSLGEFGPIDRVAETSGLPLIKVRRRLSSRLLELNGSGALNGHIPISAVIAFVLPVCAILYGFDSAVLSNERSASSGNLHYNGMDVNHQYSKGLEFETNVSRHFKSHLLRGFEYFSFLRPLSELQIARLFARSTAYHGVFTSCNGAFKLDAGRRIGRWCCRCPKCRSTFLLLAPFLEKKHLISIFERNLLDEEEQIDGYAELLGVHGFKPFECVGEPDEYMAALLLLSRNSDWREDRVISHFLSEALSTLSGSDRPAEDAFSFSENHIIPPRYEALIRAYSRF